MPTISTGSLVLQSKAAQAGRCAAIYRPLFRETGLPWESSIVRLRSLFRFAGAAKRVAIATPKPKPILAGTTGARQSEHRINNNNQLLLNTNASATPLLV